MTTCVDALAKQVHAISTRRRAARLVAGIAGGGLAVLLGVVRAAPGEQQHHRQRRRRRRRRRQRRRVRRDERTRAKGGPALYPELRTLQPALPQQGGAVDMARAVDVVDGLPVLRFTNTVWNAGQGRLELEGSTNPAGGPEQPLYQNLYDAPVGGRLVDRRQVNGRIVYHESHDHYHFADFASYRLLRRDDEGVYRQVEHGEKTSFCIIDSTPGPAGVNHPRTYTHCEQRRQGLTPGWADTYLWNLPDQWVVLPEWPLLPGEYAVQSVADPRGLLHEGNGDRELNNAATTYLRFEDDIIVNVRDTP